MQQNTQESSFNSATLPTRNAPDDETSTFTNIPNQHDNPTIIQTLLQLPIIGENLLRSVIEYVSDKIDQNTDSINQLNPLFLKNIPNKHSHENDLPCVFVNNGICLVSRTIRSLIIFWVAVLLIIVLLFYWLIRKITRVNTSEIYAEKFRIWEQKRNYIRSQINNFEYQIKNSDSTTESDNSSNLNNLDSLLTVKNQIIEERLEFKSYEILTLNLVKILPTKMMSKSKKATFKGEFGISRFLTVFFICSTENSRKIKQLIPKLPL